MRTFQVISDTRIKQGAGGHRTAGKASVSKRKKLSKSKLRTLLDDCGWNKAEVARRLGVSHTSVWKYRKTMSSSDMFPAKLYLSKFRSILGAPQTGWYGRNFQTIQSAFPLERLIAYSNELIFQLVC